jgi:hypothetical protein
MLKEFIITLLLSIFLCTDAAAADNTPACTRLQEKAGGELLKYSLQAEANGALFFSGISCAIKHRNKELCATEMVKFDNSAKVHDYYTADEIDIGRAFFWLDESDGNEPILAFSSREGAEKYGAEKEKGLILDYTALTKLKLK